MQLLLTSHPEPGATRKGPERHGHEHDADVADNAADAAEAGRIDVDRPTMVLLNPRADNGRAARLAEPVRQWLKQHAPRVALIESDSIERSRATLQCLPRSSRVVLVGGDGTVHHMLPVLLTHRLALGLVPLGCSNDLARALGLLGMPWAKALRLALTGNTRRVDVGELVTPRLRVPFLSSLAVGLDAAVARRMLVAPRWLEGSPRWWWATLAELASPQTHTLRATVDGELRHDGSALFCSVFNTPTYGNGLVAVPAARVADGRLDLLVAGRIGRVGALALLSRLRKGQGAHLQNSKVATHAFGNLRIDSDRDLPLAADGEPLEVLRRFDVAVRASAVSVVSAPARRR